jgi:SAM-dependent methyltransferase
LQAVIKLSRPAAQDQVLDVATGTGHTALALAPFVQSVIGLDLAEGMLAQAKRLAEERTISNVNFQRGSAECLPFPDGSFTLITSRHAPHHFGDVNKFLVESRRVLRPKGRLIVADQVSPTNTVKDWVNHWEKVRDPSHYDQRTPDEWSAEATRAGFRWVEHEIVYYRLEFDWWTRQANASGDQVAALEEMAANADPQTRSVMGLEYAPDGRILAHRLPVLVTRLEPQI